MKKLVCVLCLFSLIMLTACDPSIYKVEEYNLEGVISVELIEYDNPNQKQFASWVPNHFSNLLPFELDKARVLQTLDNAALPEFISAFNECEILHTYYAYNSPKDMCIRLNCDDGRFLIVWANYNCDSYAGYIGEYLADGSVYSFWGCFCSLDDYVQLVNNYFNYII